MNIIKTYELFNWIKRKSSKEKADELYTIVEESWERLLKEAGNEEGLKVGKEFDYDNFGDFSDACYSFYDEIQDIITNDKELSRNIRHYKLILNNIYMKMLKVGHIRGVSEVSIEQFKFTKSKISKYIDAMRNL